MSEAVLEKPRQLQVIKPRHPGETEAVLMVKLAARAAELEMLLEASAAREAGRGE